MKISYSGETLEIDLPFEGSVQEAIRCDIERQGGKARMTVIRDTFILPLAGSFKP